MLLEEQGLVKSFRQLFMLDELKLSQSFVEKGAKLWDLWKKTVVSKGNLEPVTIALVGKYIALPDSKCLTTPATGCGSHVGNYFTVRVHEHSLKKMNLF